MPAVDFQSLVRDRLRAARLDEDDVVVERVCAYLEILAKWNTRINLTAFDLALPTSEAIDRLIVEPLAAAEHLRPSDQLVVDIGSGGGSPALPLKIAASATMRMVLIEARTRRSAFLREAVRMIGLENVEVLTSRVEPGWQREDLEGHVDLVTFRAVRPDAALWRSLSGLLRHGGRVFWFTDLVKSHNHDISGFDQSESSDTFTVFERQ